MTATRFRTETGAGRFEIEPAWRLLVPSAPTPPGGRPLVVCLHGMGMTAELFAMVLNGLLDDRAAYLLPQGIYPYEIRRESRIRIGYSWYLYDGHEALFRQTLERTEGYLIDLIDSLMPRAGCDPARLFLLGFSMGAYTGYYVALKHPGRFAGFVAIGGRMKEEFVRDDLPASAGRLPILILHGEEDTAVPLERARSTYDTLVANGFEVGLRTFPKGHEIRDVEVRAAHEWLGRRFSARGTDPALQERSS